MERKSEISQEREKYIVEHRTAPIALTGELDGGVDQVIGRGLATFLPDLQGESKKTCLAQLNRYLTLVLEKNKVMNLTAIRIPEEAALRHIVDSLTLLSLQCIHSGDRILDIGSGAGFPAAPLAICTDCQVTALDSVQKKVRFINESAEYIGLSNLTGLSGRAEELAHSKLRESFDIVTARGVTKLRMLVEYALPFLKTGGYLLAMKGEAIAEEFEEAKTAINVLGGGEIQLKKVALPGSEIIHSVIIVRKRSQTSTKYPRKQAAILKSPL